MNFIENPLWIYFISISYLVFSFFYFQPFTFRFSLPSLFFLTISQNQNPAYSNLLVQRSMVNDVIEDVVTFENGGLNNSVDAMTEVSKGVI